MVLTTMRKVLAYGPAVVVSTVLTFTVGAVLPATLGLAMFVGGLATLVALLLGADEALAVRLLFRARELNAAEAAVLAPAVALLCQHGVPMGALRLQVQDGAVPIAAGGAGRRTVVVSAGLVAAVRDRQLLVDQAAAVLGHGALSRAGLSDFHTMTARNRVIAAYDGTLRISQDGTTWRTASIDPAPRDLALSPDAATLVATTEKGPLVSTDLALSWQPMAGAPLLLLAAWADATTLVGATPTGQVTLSRDRGRSWTNVGKAVGQPQALSATATGKKLEVLVVTDRAILASTGGGFGTPA
ncbi:hypothetical protein [Knoellia koreensis]|uniref:Glycosyl hydrolase n=1 Tax=Knoellia koreensis TaxID=2730921 RepID=A0A849HKL2_9MICO|nr:hypothetical protein [Knoellia sp. DB2414S]NNM47822.1 hypothetical protein [Knoellia sp. DB2414S]